MTERGNTRDSAQKGSGAFWILIILVIAVAVRLAYVWHYSGLPEWSMLTVDNYYHHHWALDIAGGNVLGDTTYFRAPLYVWCLGLLYAVVGASLWTGRVFGMIVGLASVFLTFRIGCRLFDRRTGLLSSLLHALYPMIIYFEFELLLDPLFLLLMELAVYRMIIWWQQSTGRNIVWSGLALGLACITRPTGLLLFPVLLALPLVRFKYRDRWRAAFLGAVSCLVVIAPVTLRNLAIEKDLTLIASQGGINFYLGNNEAADGLAAVMPEPFGYNWQLSDMVGLARQEQQDPDMKPGDISRYWYARGLHWVGEHPAEAVRLYLKKLYFFVSSDEISNNRDLPHFFSRLGLRGALSPMFGVLLGLSVLGLVINWREQRLVRLLAVVIVLLSLVSAAFFFTSRFRLPLLPFYFVLAASGLTGVLSMGRNKRPVMLFGLLAGLLAGILAYSGLFALPPASRSQALLAEGRYFYHQGNLSAAQAAMKEALLDDDAFPELNTALGTVFLQSGQSDSARVYMDREIAFNPNNTTGLNNRVALDLAENKVDSTTVALNERALQIRPWDKTVQQLRLRLGLAMGKPAREVLQDIAEAATETDDHIDVLNEGAVVLSQLQEFEAAERLARRAVLSDPPPIEMNSTAFDRSFDDSPERWRQKQARSHYLLGYFNGLKGNYQEAIDQSRTAIARNPDLIEAYLNLYSGYLSTGDYRKADSVLTLARDRFGRQRVESLMPRRP